MSQTRKYRPATRKNKTVKWFGFYLTETSAPLLFIGSVVAIVLCLIGLFALAINFIALLSAYSAIEEAGGMSGFTAAYGSTVLIYYLIYIVVILVILGIAIYTLNKTKQLRG